MLSQTNIKLKKVLHLKQIFQTISHSYQLNRGFSVGTNAKRYIYYHYSTASRNFNYRSLLHTKPMQNILSVRNFSRDMSTATTEGMPIIIVTNLKQSFLNNNTTLRSSISSNNNVDIIQFVNLIKNGDFNMAKSFLSTHNYCTTIINTLEFKDSLKEHLNSSTESDIELFNKANDILYDHLIQLAEVKAQDLEKFNEEYIQASLKHNLHKTDPQVLNLYNELSCKGKPICPNLDLFCIYFLSTIISRNFELSPKKEFRSSTKMAELPLLSINRECLDTFVKALRKGDVEGAKTLLSVNNYATTIHDTLEFSESLRHHLDSNHELYHASDRFLKEYLKTILVPSGNMQELIKLIEDYNQYSLKYYLEKSSPQQVLSIYEGFLQKENFKLSYESKLVIFCAYIKLNDERSALSFFISEISSSPEFSLPTFTNFIQSLSNELEYNKIQEILRCHYIQKLSPNSEEFTNYIKRLFFNKTLTTTNSALNLYQKLCDLEVKLNSITYGAFIMGFLSHDKYNEAEFIFNDMIKRGQKPTQVIYNEMLDGFSRRRNVRKIHEIWQQMLDDKIKPDEFAYCAMMETYFRTGESLKAIEMFQQMSLDPKIKLNEIIYNRVIDGLLSNNRVDEAIIIYNQMKNQKITPNIVTYNTLINKLLDKKKEQFAMNVLQDMQQFNITPDVTTLTTLLKRQFQNRNVKGVQNVLNMFDSMKIQPNLKTYGTLINGLVNYFNDLAGAEMAFKEMIYKRGLFPNIQIYSNMIQAYINHGKFSLAEQLYSDLIQNNCFPTTATFNLFIGGYSRAINMDKAIKYYEEMINLRLNPSDNTYKALINGYITSKNMLGASQIYDNMIKAKFIPENTELKKLCQIIEQWRSRQLNINQTLKS